MNVLAVISYQGNKDGIVIRSHLLHHERSSVDPDEDEDGSQACEDDAHGKGRAAPGC